MKILFFGDSVTDASRNKEKCEVASCSLLGFGYVNQIAGRLLERDPVKYEILNLGISGNRVTDLYARAKRDLWNHAPDLVSILIGVNDFWHDIDANRGVEPPRFEKVYRMLIEETRERLPNTKILLISPFVLRGKATEERWEQFSICNTYIEIVERLAKEYGLYYLSLQDKLRRAADTYGDTTFLYDGVHPTPAGASLIASAWLEKYSEIEKEIPQ